VFYHLKQKAAQKGLIKRVLYYQPFVAEVGTPAEKKMLNMTVYEDSDPAQLAIEAGKQFGLPPNQQGQLKVAIESQVLQRVQVRPTGVLVYLRARVCAVLLVGGRDGVVGWRARPVAWAADAM
jgi:hypothetical protein